jgi:hypothetical protein
MKRCSLTYALVNRHLAERRVLLHAERLLIHTQSATSRGRILWYSLADASSVLSVSGCLTTSIV